MEVMTKNSVINMGCMLSLTVTLIPELSICRCSQMLGAALLCVLHTCYWNVFGLFYCWLDKTSIIKMSPCALGNGEKSLTTSPLRRKTEKIT